MAAVQNILFCCTLLITITKSFAQETDENTEDPESRTFGFLFGNGGSRGERACRYRRQQGFCRKLSECSNPTRRTCRYDNEDPIVCCLDRYAKATTTTTTTRNPTTKRPNKDKEIDLTFPKCGFRSPQASESLESRGRQNSARSASRSVLGGILRRRGKREAPEYIRSTRKKRFSAVRPVIVGGREAKSNSWPWMVAIFKSSGSDGGNKRFLCGGSLVSTRYVVTASHCFDAERGNIDPKRFTITVGSHTSKDGTEYSVESILRHPGYKERQYYNDLCVMKIGEPVKLNAKTYPVCLPSDSLRNKINPSENNVTVTGWGDTSFGGVASKVLLEVTMPIVPLKECNASYWKVARTSFPQGITDLFVCAGVEEGGKDACQGDSGGPMVSKLKDNSWVQLGVVSFGYGCARPGFPGVYTRLSKFTEWLYENTDLGRS